MIASSLKIMLWDKEIGRLSWDARRGVSFFEYNPAFLGGRLDPFPLVASVKSPASRRPIMGDRETKLYRKLPPFLADSLPDAWGNQVFECWRIQNGIRNQHRQGSQSNFPVCLFKIFHIKHSKKYFRKSHRHQFCFAQSCLITHN